MPTRLVASFKTIGIIVGTVSGLLGFAQGYAILPYRLSQTEKAIENIQTKRDFDHDLLVKIAQDIEYLKQRSK